MENRQNINPPSGYGALRSQSEHRICIQFVYATICWNEYLEETDIKEGMIQDIYNIRKSVFFFNQNGITIKVYHYFMVSL